MKLIPIQYKKTVFKYNSLLCALLPLTITTDIYYH